MRSYVQSGNVAFSTRVARGKLAGMISGAIADTFGYDDVPVVLRTQKELAKVLAANPWPRHAEDERSLHVTFLDAAPAKKRVAELPPAAGPDVFEVRGKEVYLHCPRGYGKTKLNNNFFEKKLQVTATTRNWRSVRALHDM